MKKLLLILLVLAQLSLQAQTPVKIIDETYLDASFKDFVTDLNTAVQLRDVNLLRPLLADSVWESKDGCGHCPKDGFIKYMFYDRPGSESWNEWKEVLRFGFYKANDNQFEAPSYRKFLNQDSSLIVLGTKVNVRETPGKQGKVLFQSSFEKFDCDCYIISVTKSTVQEVDGNAWHEVKLRNGGKGYVLFDLTSEKIWRELVIKKIKNKWRVTSFLSPPGC